MDCTLHTKDLLLPLIGALWACATLVFHVTKELNGLRDKVIYGKDAGHPIDPEHRLLLMNNDWRPMAASVVFVSLSFGFVAAFLPLLLPDGERWNAPVWITAGFVSAANFFMAFAWIIAGMSDWRMMKREVAVLHPK